MASHEKGNPIPTTDSNNVWNKKKNTKSRSNAVKADGLQKENQELRLLNSTVESKLVSATERVRQLEYAAHENEEELSTLKRVLSTFEHVRTNLELQRDTFKNKCSSIESELSRLKLENKTKCGLCSSLETKLLESRAKCQELEIELEEKNLLTRKLNREININVVDLQAKIAQEEYLTIRVRNLEKDVESGQTQVKYLEAGMNKLLMSGEECAKKGPVSKVVLDEDPVWLFSVDSNSLQMFLLDLDFTPQQVTWFNSLDSLREFLPHLLQNFGFENETAEFGSREFWTQARKSLSLLCENDVGIVVGCSLCDDELLLGQFISVVAEAYEACSNPGKVVVVLEEWQRNQIEGFNYEGLPPKIYDVMPYVEWAED